MPDPALFRFGLGPAAGGPPPQPAAQLAGPDAMAQQYPAPDRANIFARLAALRAARNATPRDDDALRAAEAAMTDQILTAQRRLFARALDTGTPYRERLVRFWTGHFSITPKQRVLLPEGADMVETAIRPNVAGRFADMLKAAILHPAMIRYLDQDSSLGPNSRAGRNRGRGLNENLARELLELHTLGVGAPYGQADVRATALLLTGYTVVSGEAVFEPRFAEPGIQTILGRRYGGMIRDILDGEALLDDLAARPETAAHLSRKLAVHFVADDPPAELVADLTRVWRQSDGDLAQVSAALAGHPAALAAPAEKIRPPFELLTAALRALGVTGAAVMDLPDGRLHRLLLTPQTAMGQNWRGAPSPAGWPEAAAEWLTAPALAARIDWAMDAPARLLGGRLPDPRAFVDAALGPEAPARLRRLVAAAESQAEGLGLILAAPAFQRR